MKSCLGQMHVLESTRLGEIVQKDIYSREQVVATGNEKGQEIFEHSRLAIVGHQPDAEERAVGN